MFNLNESNRIVMAPIPTDIHVGRDEEYTTNNNGKDKLQTVCYES